MNSTSRGVDELFASLGDPVRLRLACCLLAVPRGACVCELVDALDVSQPNVSRHLKVLKGARLVEERRDGRWMYYHLRPPDQPVLERIRSCLETVSGCADLQVDLRRLRARLDLRRDGRCGLGTRVMASRPNAGRGGERTVRLRARRGWRRRLAAVPGPPPPRPGAVGRGDSRVIPAAPPSPPARPPPPPSQSRARPRP